MLFTVVFHRQHGFVVCTVLLTDNNCNYLRLTPPTHSLHRRRRRLLLLHLLLLLAQTRKIWLPQEVVTGVVVLRRPAVFPELRHGVHAGHVPQVREPVHEVRPLAHLRSVQPARLFGQLVLAFRLRQRTIRRKIIQQRSKARKQ
jgi:hypothetical protein